MAISRTIPGFAISPPTLPDAPVDYSRDDQQRVRAILRDAIENLARPSKLSKVDIVSGGKVSWDNDDVTITHAANALAFAGASNGYSFDATVYPAANDGGSLGKVGAAWSDVFLASGGVVNWNNGTLTLTESSGTALWDGVDHHFRSNGNYPSLVTTRLDVAVDGSAVGSVAFSGKDSGGTTKTYARAFAIANDTTPGSEYGSIEYYIQKAGTLTGMGRLNATSWEPFANDGAALGSGSYAWSDFYLAAGGTINFSNSDVIITHVADGLSFSAGIYLANTNPAVSNVAGWSLITNGKVSGSVDGGQAGDFNRKTNDGTICNWRQDGAIEGAVTVSGTTITYATFCGSHYSQLEDLGIIDIPRGTIVETIDDMCSWPGEENEQLARFKISDTLGSSRVYGVFMDWHAEDLDSNDALIASLGAYIIRIAAGVPVQGGEPIESNGDGCARVQADDIVRTRTIGKVTSNYVIETYPDGSYLVPCVLYCG